MHIKNQENYLDVRAVVRYVAWPSRPVTCSPPPVRNQSQGSHLDENRWQQAWHPPPAASPLRSLFECTHLAFHSTRKQRSSQDLPPYSLVSLIQKGDLLTEMISLTLFSWVGVKARTRVCFCPGFKHLRLLRREKLSFRSNRDDLSWLFFSYQGKSA